jgi:hypothetical protein
MDLSLDYKSHAKIYTLIENLRNGAMISGNEPYTQAYRQRCLEQAYVEMVDCENILGEWIQTK